MRAAEAVQAADRTKATRPPAAMAARAAAETATTRLPAKRPRMAARTQAAVEAVQAVRAAAAS